MTIDMLQFPLLVIVYGLFSSQECFCEEYYGTYIAPFVPHTHAVIGDVFAINESAILIKNFNYDGLDNDAFFWAGSDSDSPNGRGFIIPDEKGTTNVLKSYINKDVVLLIPGRYKLSNLKWIAIYNIRGQIALADVIFPSDFVAPVAQTISSFEKTSSGVSSKPIEVIDTRTVRIPGFSFDGKTPNVFFWIGNGEEPNFNGSKVPNDEGSLQPLTRYKDKTITIYLLGKKTIIELDYLSLWSTTTKKSLGFVLFPKDLKIPPAFGKYIPSKTSLSQCESLHQRMEVSWTISAGYITIQLSGSIAENEYLAFGISSNNKSSDMMGADITIAWKSGFESKADDYYVDADIQCSGNRGICPDTVAVRGSNNNQLLAAESENGVVSIMYRRPIKAIDSFVDREIYIGPNQPTYIVWGIGPRDSKNLPRTFTQKIDGNMSINFGRQFTESKCIGFYIGVPSKNLNPWEDSRLLGKDNTFFSFRIGPTGGRKGYSAITGIPSSNQAWYVNGSLIPELVLKRGETYTFIVEGGNNSTDLVNYHPLYITSDAEGGFGQKSEEERSKEIVYAGIVMNRERKYTPLAAGRLCEFTQSSHSDPESYHEFSSFFETLRLKCLEGIPATLQWTPNSSAPDTVYYQSFTHRNMGWRIKIVNDFVDMQFSVSSAKTKYVSFLCYTVTILILYIYF